MQFTRLNILVILLIFPFSLLRAQLPSWNWATSTSGPGDESGQAICSDSQGNSYVAGFYTGSTLAIANTTFSNGGLYDFLLAKYDSQGNIIWAQAGGGASSDALTGVCSDASGNIYVSGLFYSSTMAIGATTLTNSGLGDILVIKYTQAGNLVWVKSFGSPSDENANAICCDAMGNIYITGFFNGSQLQMDTFTLTGTGAKDSFVAGLDGSGNVLWARNFDCSGYDEGSRITTDNAGNVILSGYYKLNPIVIDTNTLNISGATDVYITKLDAAGNVLWATSAGGGGYEFCNSVSCDNSGNIFVAGDFMSTDFAAGTLTLSNNGGFDAFALKLDPSGAFQLAISEGNIFDDTATGITANGNSGFFMTGHFHSPSIIIGTYTFSSYGLGDIYVAGYDQSGLNQWAVQLGGTDDDGSSGISLVQPSKLRITGFYLSSEMTAGSYTLTNSGGSDLFCTELTWPVTSVSAPQQVAELVLYPNPARDFIQIRSSFAVKKAEIWSMSGEKIAEFNNPGERINLSGYTSGLYLIGISDENRVVYLKTQINGD